MSRPRLTALFLALITLAVYLPAGHDDFLNFDDGDYVADNPIVQSGLTWAGVKWAFTTWHANNWHPLTWLSLMTDCELFGVNAGAIHYVNVLLHAANAVLLLLLLFRLTGKLWPSAFVAMLFAWHPLHVESVAWVAERKDVLSTCFGLLTLLAYVRHARQPSSAADSARKPAARRAGSAYFVALVCFLLGLLAKPMLVTLPFLLLLLDYWPLQRLPNCEFRPRALAALVLEKWPFFLLSIGACIMTFLAQHQGGVVLSLQQLPLAGRVGNALLSYAQYLAQAFWPVGLAIFYPLPNPLPWLAVAAAAICLTAVTVTVWCVRRRRPCLLMGWLWFLGTLVPVIGLVQVGSQAHSDRYTYLPLVGIFIMVAFGVPELLNRFVARKILAAAAVLMLAGCVALTENQLRFWRNSESLFRHATEVTKDNDGAYYSLGLALAGQHQPQEALAAYRQAERIAPGRFETHRNLGSLLGETGHTGEALAEFREALRLRPDLSSLHADLAVQLAELGQVDEALKEYAAAARLDPADPTPHYLAGRTLLRQGRDAEAVDEFHTALRIKGDDLPTLLFLASVRAADESQPIRNGAEATALAEKAAAITGGEQPAVLEVLAMAYAEAGQFKPAQQFEQRAIQMAGDAGVTNLEVLNQRLELYRAGQPYREKFARPATRNGP